MRRGGNLCSGWCAKSLRTTRVVQRGWMCINLCTGTYNHSGGETDVGHSTVRRHPVRCERVTIVRTQPDVAGCYRVAPHRTRHVHSHNLCTTVLVVRVGRPNGVINYALLITLCCYSNTCVIVLWFESAATPSPIML